MNSLKGQNKKRQVKRTSINPTRVISFTSGKGGVGKTVSVVNVASALVELGNSVLVFDADLSLANIDVMLGINPNRTLEQVLSGAASVEEVLVHTEAGFDLIPASSGVNRLSHLSVEQRYFLSMQLQEVAYGYDYLLIDTAAGISEEVLHFNAAAQEVYCIIQDEPTSLTDGYALIKTLVQREKGINISVIVNNSKGELEALQAYKKLENVVSRYLHIQLKLLGFVPADELLPESVRQQRLLLQSFPSSKAAISLRKLAKRIDTEVPDLKIRGGMQFFFHELLDVAPAR